MTPSEQVLDRLRTICRIPSVTADTVQVAHAVDWLVATYGPLSDHAEILRGDSGAPIGLLLSFGADTGGDRVTFYNYVDVTAPGDPAGWTHDPFAADLDGSRLYARGAASNKGDLVARLEAVTGLLAEGRLRREVVFWIDAAEEHGSPGLESMLARWSDRLAAPHVIWNTGFVNQAGEPIVGCGFKGVLIARLTAHCGRAGHSGVGIGASAVHRLIDVVTPWLGRSNQPPPDGIEESLQLVNDAGILDDLVPSEALEHADGDVRRDLVIDALLAPTANVPWFDGGRPDELTRYAEAAACALELRLVGRQRTADALVAIEEQCRARGVTCEPVIRLEPYALTATERTEVVRALEPALHAGFGRVPRVLPVVPFSARAHEVAEALGARIASVGTTDRQSAPHGADESIDCELLAHTVAFVRALVGEGTTAES